MTEFDKYKYASPVPEVAILRENRAHRILVRVLLLMMVVEWIVLLIEQRWLSAFLVTLFAFSFAVTIGTIWEIFEFTMDRLFGLNMQKPMMGDPSGLTDTMWDMIVNAMGAFIISFVGWWYLKRKRGFFVKNWIRKFIMSNPELFNKR